MKASEALKISQQNKTNLSNKNKDESKLKTIYKLIKKAASKGSTSIAYSPWMSINMCEALTELGYKVKNSPKYNRYSKEEYKPYLGSHEHTYRTIISWDTV